MASGEPAIIADNTATPRIEPTPNTAMYKSPAATVGAAARLRSAIAADPPSHGPFRSGAPAAAGAEGGGAHAPTAGDRLRRGACERACVSRLNCGGEREPGCAGGSAATAHRIPAPRSITPTQNSSAWAIRSGTALPRDSTTVPTTSSTKVWPTPRATP